MGAPIKEGLTGKIGSDFLQGCHVGPTGLESGRDTPLDGVDIVMGPLEEDISLGDSESLKLPRILSLQPVVSVSKDSTGASLILSAGLDHGVNRSQ
ncbi:hypothetical protein V6N11_049807 [Hibiscus sabdariffa]|uniref:Uncharacterized protein n=2 Tax=Hibiscus sabdariffa TaxID=183260 RepID=A0ABR2A0L5_9ROSI